MATEGAAAEGGKPKQRKRTAFDESGKIVRLDKEEEVGFFEQLLTRQEAKLIASGEMDAPQAIVGDASQVSQTVGYAAEKGAEDPGGRRRLMRAKQLTEDKYDQAFKGGMESMQGHSKDDHLSTGAIQAAMRLKFKTRIHKDKSTDYGTLFQKARARKSQDRVSRQRQWASNWKEKHADCDDLSVPWTRTGLEV